MSDLKEYYQKTVTAELQKQFEYKNIMEIPRVVKVTLNMGVGEAVNDKKAIESAEANLARIAGQKVIVTHAKKAVASFKIRAGWPIGCKVTLRGKNMYDFIRRLVDIAIPRIRDFRGLNHKSFDGRGNYSFGVKELIIFPEIDFDKFATGKIPGLDVCITTTAKSDDEARALLKALNFPIK